MRRSAFGIALIAGVLMVGTPVAAQEQEIVVDGTGWYSSFNLDSLLAETGGVPLGDPLANLTFEQGDLPVGAVGTDEHKRSYLELSIPEGATGAVIELPLSETTATSFGVPGPILACSVPEPMFVFSGGNLDDAPEVDCGDDPVVGEPNADLLEGETATAFIFDLAPILARWNAGDPGHGIALVADVREPQSAYQVVFRAGLFEPVGSATGGTAADGPEPFDPPGGVASGAPDAPAPQGNGGGFSAAPIAPSGPLDSGDALAPPTAPDPQAAGPPDPESGQAATEEVAAGAPVGIPPVNPLAWLLALPLCASLLFASGRSLRGAGQAPSSLDRLLAR